MSICRMVRAGFRNDRMCPHLKNVTVPCNSRATERNTKRRHRPMLTCLTRQGASSTVTRRRARHWDTRPKPAKKLRKSVTYLRVTSLSSKSTCSCARGNASWKLHGNTASSELTMLIASKLNVSTRHKDQPRTISKGKKISLTIGELEVSYNLIYSFAFFFGSN